MLKHLAIFLTLACVTGRTVDGSRHNSRSRSRGCLSQLQDGEDDTLLVRPITVGLQVRHPNLRLSTLELSARGRTGRGGSGASD